MNWRKEERTDGKTSSLPAVCGLVWRFLDMEISRREETMAVGRTRAEGTGGRSGVPY